MNKLRLLVIRHTQSLLAHQVSGLIESAGDMNRHRAPVFNSFTRDLLPAVAEPELAEFVMMLNRQPIVHILHGIIERQWKCGRQFRQPNRSAVAVATQNILFGFLDDGIRLAIDPSCSNWQRDLPGGSKPERREIDLSFRRPLSAPFLLEPEQRPENLGKKRPFVGHKCHVVQILVAQDCDIAPYGELAVNFHYSFLKHCTYCVLTSPNSIAARSPVQSRPLSIPYCPWPLHSRCGRL